MKVKYYANACFSLFHDGLHILCDPWLEGPAVAGGWTPFPPCRTRVKDLDRPDLIYISHIHSDHCEDLTLEKLDKTIPVLSLDRNPNFLKTRLERENFETIHWVPEGEVREILPGLRVETFGASYDHVAGEFVDSSVLFDFDGAIVLNCNDNAPEQPFCEDIAKRYPKIDLAFLPRGGGGGYPAMYGNLSEEEKITAAHKTIANYADIFTQAIDILKPRVVVPVAGGYAICGPLAEKVNRWQPRSLDATEIVAHHKQHGAFQTDIFPMQDQMVLDVDAARIIEGTFKVWSDREIDDFFAELTKMPITRPVTTARRHPDIHRLIERARQRMHAGQKKLGLFPDYTIYLDIDGEPMLTALPLNGDAATQVDRDGRLAEPYLRITLDQDTMLEWLLGFEDFNMLDSGHRLEFYRAPNDYVPEAYVLMSLLRL